MHDPRLIMFGLSLKHCREQRQWTQEQVAILLHYEDQSMICMIEKGLRAPSFLQAVEMAQLFDTTVNEMCGYRLPGTITHHHAGTVSMQNGFVMFGGLEGREIRDIVETVTKNRQPPMDRDTSPSPTHEDNVRPQC
jgi:DNA-binding XRE family transcriptional regulator